MAERRLSAPAPKKAGKDSYLIQPLRDRERLHLLLEAERAYAAFALAQLEPDLFAQSEWWFAAGDGSEALLMHSRGGLGNALVAFGDPHALPALLSLHPGPAQTFATFREDHLEAMQRSFLLARDQPMLRMMVTAETFAALEPGEDETKGVVEVKRLSNSDIPEIEGLYSTEGNRFFYRPSHIDEGVYFGVFSDAQLVAVAGTHAVSRANGIAVVGNVFTHPLHRNHRFAMRATGAVTETLLETCPEVVLTVDPLNAAAVRAYSRLGYREECRLIECGVTRKEMLGLGTLTRRLLARWRGRTRGGELVTLARDGHEDGG